ncbi:hypothetical protein CLF_101090 [Clonorchis sinensis]|uniref:Uncharacterized protein n=1 Tax=Clonorchis sinensis TaxID=79923 RepID=G7Y4Z5_CLOSI|nr:hypothetical protein CLF_101090 [Clonorchis sinensis]
MEVEELDEKANGKFCLKVCFALRPSRFAGVNAVGKSDVNDFSIGATKYFIRLGERQLSETAQSARINRQQTTTRRGESRRRTIRQLLFRTREWNGDVHSLCTIAKRRRSAGVNRYFKQRRTTVLYRAYYIFGDHAGMVTTHWWTYQKDPGSTHVHTGLRANTLLNHIRRTEPQTQQPQHTLTSLKHHTISIGRFTRRPAGELCERATEGPVLGRSMFLMILNDSTVDLVNPHYFPANGFTEISGLLEGIHKFDAKLCDAPTVFISKRISAKKCQPVPKPQFTHLKCGTKRTRVHTTVLVDVDEVNSGVQVVDGENLVDLECTGDIALIFEDEDKAQALSCKLNTAIPSFGMHLAHTNCKLQSVQSLSMPVAIQGGVLDVVESFTYL